PGQDAGGEILDGSGVGRLDLLEVGAEAWSLAGGVEVGAGDRGADDGPGGGGGDMVGGGITQEDGVALLGHRRREVAALYLGGGGVEAVEALRREHLGWQGVDDRSGAAHADAGRVAVGAEPQAEHGQEHQGEDEGEQQRHPVAEEAAQQGQREGGELAPGRRRRWPGGGRPGARLGGGGDGGVHARYSLPVSCKKTSSKVAVRTASPSRRSRSASAPSSPAGRGGGTPTSPRSALAPSAPGSPGAVSRSSAAAGSDTRVGASMSRTSSSGRTLARTP